MIDATTSSSIGFLLAAVAGGYVAGSIPFAVIMSRWFGVADPRSFGSGNPGASNVLRSGHRGAALLTLLGDALKGTAAVWIVAAVGARFGAPTPDTVLAATALAAFGGHLFPVFLGFRGGKGVATFVGILLAFAPLWFAACGALWLVIAFAFRFSSLASISAAAAAPLVGWGLGASLPIIAAVAVMSALVIWRHRQNIRDLIAGRERRIGARSGAP